MTTIEIHAHETDDYAPGAYLGRIVWDEISETATAQRTDWDDHTTDQPAHREGVIIACPFWEDSLNRAEEVIRELFENWKARQG